MPAERYFIESLFIQGQELCIEGVELHHLVHVMRARPGDCIEVVNGKGLLGTAQIKSIGKKSAFLEIQSITEEPVPPCRIILAQAIPRINRLDFIMEKGTELGMSEIWLFPGKYSERKSFTPHQQERLKAIAISALKQCGRLYLPLIEFKPPLDKWETIACPAYFGDTKPDAPPFAKLRPQQTPQEIIFFIGPESGFAEDELAQLAALGAAGVKLHQNILRTDTAALVALVHCQNTTPL